MRVKLTNKNSNVIDFTSPVFNNKVTINPGRSVVINAVASELKYYKEMLPGIGVIVEEIKKQKLITTEKPVKRASGRKKVTL